MADEQGARPYASYFPGEHPQDTATAYSTLELPTNVAAVLQAKVRAKLDALDPNDPLTKVYRQSLQPGGPAWTNTPYSLLVDAVSEVLADFAAKLNLVIDTVSYLHLGQPGFVPSPDPGNEVPGFEYDPWPAPQYPSTLPDEDQDPIEKL